ncbi:MAG: cytochrome c biogenesis protein CcdA [Bacteroidota bacterium]
MKTFLKSPRKPLILLFFSFLISNIGLAQIENPVKWSTAVEKTSDKEAVLVMTATIEKGWHLYSQFIADGGPIKTTFAFEANSNFKTVGGVTEGKAVEYYDKSYEMQLKYFGDKAVFKQKISLLSANKFSIKGSVEFMVCDDEKCLPPDLVELNFDVPGNGAKPTPPVNAVDSAAIAPIDSTPKTDSPTPPSSDQMLVSSDGPMTALEPGCGEMEGEEDVEGIWAIFIAGFIGGLLALLTPCVFPMLPMTVSFFTKRSGDRKKALFNAIVYAISIIVIYVGLGFLVTVTLGSDALNEMASNSFFNLAFFFIFIIFAASFLGAFEITLPSWLINKADAASDKGGLIGIFFMAFTLSLVSFSCTGPIIGTLLVEAAHGGSYLGPLAGMFGFSLALAIPFAFFAGFPSLLASLPKSGGWLNAVKVSLGFLELALALKFLSNVDLAYHWGFLKRELFVALWVIIFGLWGLYLIGKIRFSHDSPIEHLSVSRTMMAIIVFSFTLYLIPGLWGAPLKLISGFPPPEFYKEWVKPQESECPHNLTCFKDYEEGMKYAKLQGKPVMLDFTGWSCVNCRKMEDNVWSQPEVLKRLSEKYVIISLYVDDKKPLPADQQYVAESGKKIVTTGNKWSDMQRTQYKTNSQPYYVLLDNNGKILANPRGYTPDVDTYVKFLDEGLCRYQKRTNK